MRFNMIYVKFISVLVLSSCAPGVGGEDTIISRHSARKPQNYLRYSKFRATLYRDVYRAGIAIDNDAYLLYPLFIWPLTPERGNFPSWVLPS